MTMTISEKQAQRLYSILDEHVGVFRASAVEELSSGAKRFYHEKHLDFVELFTSSIPATYWFQGFACSSVTLVHSEVEGFQLTMDKASRQDQQVLDAVNAALRAERFDDEAQVHGDHEA